MPISIICVGKLRESFYRDAAAEYLKRLKRLTPVAVVELPDEKEPANPTPALCRQSVEREGEKILAKIAPQDYVIALCINARQWESPALARHLSQLFTQGKSHVAFVIGGSLGLSDAVLRRADERLSMSQMTFPHQLARIMLLEQLFRAAKINAGERYHK